MSKLKITFKLIPLLVLLGACTGALRAATLTVTSGADSGAGTLRNQIAASNSGDIIVFSGVTTVTLTSAELLIDNNLTINGGSGVTITRSGGTTFRIFNISSGTVNLNNLTISNGNSSFGGGVYSTGGTTVNLNTCVITGNTSGQGGGIQADGTMTLTNCTISNNTSVGGEGGGVAAFGPSITFTGCTINNNSAPFYDGLFISANGIAFSMTNCTISANPGSGIVYNNSSGSPVATLTNCTITGNTWGLSMVSGTFLLKNTIIADNISQDVYSGPGFSGTVSASSSFNLIGTGGSGGLTNGVNNNQVGVVNPGLLALASNGGPTQTHALSNCSPAINTGTNSGAPSTDQRGSPRPFGGTSDIGAFELQSAPSSLTITSSVTNVLCFGGNTGSINLTVTGGTAPYTYAWTGSGSGTDPRTNLAAGTYTVTVTDNGGCTGTHSATVSQPAVIAITGAVTNVNCNGAATGAIDLTVTGGTGAYSYAWSGTGTGTDPRTGLAAGTYTVTVTDGNNCTRTSSFSVTQPSAISVTGAVTNVTCNGGTNGSINLTVTGGTGAYSYSWTGTGTGTDPRTNLAAGTYTVTVTDANNCTGTGSFTVTEPTAILIVPTVTNATCGAANGSISLAVSGGSGTYTSYVWSGTGTGTNPRTGLAVGTYTVTVTDSGNCTSTASATVAANGSTITITPTVTNATCGLSNGSISLVVSGGNSPYTYAWTGTGSGTNPRTGLAAATYTVTVTDNTNCSQTSSSTVISVDPTPPTIVCPVNQTLAAGASCTVTLPSYISMTTANDNCGAPTVTQSPAAGSVRNLGVTNVTMTATDGAGNIANCSFVVTVSDQTAPTITCPLNVITNNTTGQCSAVVVFTSPVGTDNCSGPVTIQTTGLASGASFPVGVTTNTFRVTDGAGNSSTCAFTVTVNDVQLPTLTCTANIAVATASNSCTAQVFFSGPTGSDNCPGTTINRIGGPASGSNFPLGVTTVTYRITDASGNSATCSFTVTVSDQTVPSITCPANSTVSADVNGNYTLASFTAAATASDNCTANPTKTQSPVAGTVLGVGMQTITLTATDASNNSATCSFTLTINPGCAAPTVSCPANVTVAAGANCTATLASYISSVTVTGGCGTSTLVQTPAAGTSIPIGLSTITMTATDGNSNTGACSFSVIVTDQTAPSITCPVNTTVAAGAACNATLASYIAAATASDNCTASPTKTQSPAAGTTISGTQVVTLTATDAASNSATCSFSVTVADQTAPSITCPANTTVAASAACNATLASYTAAATASDNCTASPTKTQSPAAGTTISGTQVVTLTATDAASNSATCSFSVTVADQTAPSITCPANTTVAAGANCTATLASYTAAATASDNCTASPTKTQSPAAGTTISGTQVVTLTATDAAGNSANCSFSVTVADQTAPSITCPANTTVAAGANCTATLASYTAAATASDNCTASPTKTQSPAAGTTISGTQVVTLTATDAAGNSVTCSFSVTVADQTAPSITCPANTTVAASAACNATLASYTAAATASDNCTASPTKTQSPVAGTTFSGIQVVTLTATDAAGNSANCSFSVTVADQTAPSITCPANTTVAAGANCTATLASYTAAATASDNCTASPTKTQSPVAGTTISGTQIVTLTATDAAGNSANCSFSVTVADQTAPSITCPANTTVAAGANCTATLASYTAAATASDNCTASPTKTQSPVAGTTISGTQVVTLTATDAAGNSANCSFSVVVADQTAPSITCPANTTVAAGANCTATLASYTAAATASDNCTASPTKTQSPVAGTTISGTQVVTLTATDAAGNSANCSFSVTVADQTAPSITCPANTTVAAGANCTATLASYTAAATASDNCTASPAKTQSPVAGTTISGTQVVTLTATDAAGNSANCSFSVVVADQTAPSITCPANTTVAAGANCTATLASYTAAATASDNCTASPTKTQSPVAGTTISGTQVVTLTATDAAGNSANCSFSVVVVDQTAPSITCPANATVAAGANCTATLASYTAAATASDNCTASPTRTQSPVAGTTISGTQVVTLTATDAAGNSATCSFSVVVVDQTAPSISCPANTTVAAGANCTATLASYTAAATASDNCTASPTRTQSPVAGTTISGTQVVTLTATDAAGNSANCSFSVVVVDQTAPSITCPANTTVAAGANCTATLASYTAAATASDNCTASPTRTQSPVAGTTISGTQVVTLTATDAAGNSATCSFSVTVVDQTAPNITCPANTTVAAGAACNATLASYTAAATASDNCTASPTRTQSPVAGTTISGTQVVTLTATDAAGNSATCSFSVTVVDQTAPVVNCRPATVNLNAAGSASVTTAAVFLSGSDNCGTVNLVSVTPSTFNCANIGTNSVTLTVNDGNGNTGTCVAVVTVVDNLAPTVVCKNFTANLSAAGTVTVLPVNVFQSGTDNCGVVNPQSVTPNTFTCSNVGNNLVTLVVNDNYGNTASCVATVTVADVTTPMAKCKNVSVSIGSTGSVTVLPAQVNNGTTDNCTFTLSLTPNTFTCANLGLNTVVLRATDVGGNSSTCTARVTVTDLTGPTASCKNTTIFLNDVGQASLTVAQVNNGSFDPCGIASMTLSKTQFNCSELGPTPQIVFLTATDNNGNTASCMSQVLVKDAIAPTAICQDVTVQLGPTGKATVYGAVLAAGSVDNCSVTSYSPVARVYTSANIGVNFLTITVKDYFGPNSATCVSAVTVTPYAPFNLQNEEGEVMLEEEAEIQEITKDEMFPGIIAPDNSHQDAATGEHPVLDFKVYPNPTAGDVMMEFDLTVNQECQMVIYDMFGKTAMLRKISGMEGRNELLLPVHELPVGMYLIELRTATSYIQKRLIRQE